MPPRRTFRSGPSSWQFGMVFVAIILLAGAGVGGTLWAAGYFEARESHAGQIAFPALARAVNAYDAISRDDLINPKTGQLHVIWLAQEQVTDAMHRDLRQILGRVVSRDKQPGNILTEQDFLPRGTRPGITAGIPPGKRSLSIAVDRIPGLELLRQGDKFDVLALLPVRDNPISNIAQAALLGGIKPPDSRSGQLARQEGIKPLIIGGTMVALTQGRSQSTGGSQALPVPPPGVSARNRAPGMVATLAVDALEVGPLTEALGLDVEMYCVARSGHPEDESDGLGAVSLEGLVPVVTTARPIVAFAALELDDLAEGASGRLNIYYFPPDRVDPGWLTSLSELHGRVAARNLPLGAVISEHDLMPVGTRPGIAGAVPAGMEAIPITQEAIRGLDQLRPGDWFEIHSRLPEEFRPSANAPSMASIFGGELSSGDQQRQDELRTGIRILTREAQFITCGNSVNGTNPAIAVPTDQVQRVVQALNLGHDLFVVVHGGTFQHSPGSDSVPVKLEAVDNSEHGRASSASRPNEREPNALVRLALFQPVQAPADKVQVPILVRDVSRRAILTVDDFLEPSTGQLRYFQFDPENVPAGAETDLRALLGRRAGRELSAGTWISESDVSDARIPSVPNDIPPGWAALEVNSLQVRGLDIVESGDRFDLIAARPIHALDAQGRLIWPSRRDDAVFYESSREDVFTQADIDVLAHQALVLFKDEREIEVVAYSEEMSATPPPQLGDSINRGEIVRTRVPVVQRRRAIVCHIAVPVGVIPAITEALAVQSIVSTNQNSGAADGQGSAASENDNRSEDNEVALYAVLAGPVSDLADEVPDRDIISDWSQSWGERFSKFLRQSVQSPRQVQSMQHIRGDEIRNEYWLNGRPSNLWPAEEVQDETIHRLINRPKRREE